MAEEYALVVKVDSVSAKRATDDLDHLTAASARAETATGKLGTTSTTAARAVQGHGAATATAATQAAELAESEEQAAKRIHDMVQASLAAAQASNTRVAAENAAATASRSTADAVAIQGKSWKNIAAAQTEAMQRYTAMRAPVNELQAILAKSTLTSAEVAKAEALLDASQASGIITAGELSEAFAALDAAKIKDIAVTEAQAVANKTSGLNSRAQAEIATAASEVLSGNFSRLRRTGAALANQSGLLTKLMSPVGLAIVGVSGAVIALVSAYMQGEKETFAFTQALAKTGDQSGVTGGQLSSMALDIGHATGEFGDATKAVLALVQAGHGASPALEGMAAMAVRFGVATGDMKAGIELASAAMGGSAKQIQDLDAKYNLLTASQANEVQYLFQIGEADKARQIVMRDGSVALSKRASEVEDSTGTIIKAWNAVTAAVSSAWHEMAHAGATDVSSRLGVINTQLDAFNAPGMNPVVKQLPAYQQLLSQQRALQAQLIQKGWDRTNQALDDARNKAAKGAQEWAATALAPIDELQSKLDIAVKMKDAFFAVPRTAEESARFMRSYNQQIEAAAHAYQSGMTTSQGSTRAPTDNSDKLRQMGVDDILKQVAAQGKLNDAKDKARASDAAYAAQLQDQLATRKKQIDLQVSAVGMGQKEYARQSELVEIYGRFDHQLAQLNQERDRGSISAEQYQQRLQDLKTSEAETINAVTEGFKRMDAARGNWENGLTAALQDFIDQASDVAGQTHDLFTNAFNGMADSLANFVTTGKGNFGDLVKSILADLVKMETRILISRVLTSLFMRDGTTIASNYMAGGGATYAASGVNWNVGTLGTNANGGVYSSPSLSQYSGGVYDSPRFFTFANGGVFGEAGPEAIMPLSRGSDGKLGVKATGGNVTVIVENHSDSKAEVSQSKDSNGNDILKVMIGAAVNEVNKQIGRGGSTAQVLQQTFGLSRRGVPVAG